MPVSTLHEIFVHELKDAYSAESQIIKALPGIIKKVSDEELSAALAEHLEETKNQVTRLDAVFEEIGVKPQAHLCMATQGILAEGSEAMKEAGKDVFDLVVTGSVQRIEQYEQVVYTNLIAMAKKMKHKKAADLLKETLDEEKAAGHKALEATTKLLGTVPVGHEVE